MDSGAAPATATWDTCCTCSSSRRTAPPASGTRWSVCRVRQGEEVWVGHEDRDQSRGGPGVARPVARRPVVVARTLQRYGAYLGDNTSRSELAQGGAGERGAPRVGRGPACGLPPRDHLGRLRRGRRRLQPVGALCEDGGVLLADVALASPGRRGDLARRTEKVAAVAQSLRRADPDEVGRAVGVPVRRAAAAPDRCRLGILRDLPAPVTEPTLGVSEVDPALDASPASAAPGPRPRGGAG